MGVKRPEPFFPATLLKQNETESIRNEKKDSQANPGEEKEHLVWFTSEEKPMNCVI